MPPSTPPVPTTAATRTTLAIFRDELNYPSPYRRTIAVEDLEGKHIGNVMYYNVDYQRREAEIGVTIGLREYWGRGYGTDLICDLRPLHLRTMQLDRIHLKTLDWNLRAQRCFEKAGFQRYGVSKRGEYNFVLMDIRARSVRGRARASSHPKLERAPPPAH